MSHLKRSSTHEGKQPSERQDFKNMSHKKKKKVSLSRCSSDFLESWDDVARHPVQF